MKEKPTLEEVKEYFNDALVIEGINAGNEYNIDTNMFGVIGYRINYRQGLNNKSQSILLWDKHKGYAKILTYKTKPMEFKITKEQILAIYNEIEIDQEGGKLYLRERYPEVFEVNLDKNHTGWVKTSSKRNEKWMMFFENGVLKYGIDSNGNWHTPITKNKLQGKEYEATNEEVFEALKKEAIKRGFDGGVCVKFKDTKGNRILRDNRCNYYHKDNSLCMGGYEVFLNGVWHDIIPIITIKQAEAKLDGKFKIV